MKSLKVFTALSLLALFVSCDLQRESNQLDVEYTLPVASMHQKLIERLGDTYVGIDSIRIVSAARSDLNRLFKAATNKPFNADTSFSFQMRDNETVVLDCKWYANGMRVASFIDTLDDQGVSTNPRYSFSQINEIPDAPFGEFSDSVYVVYDGAFIDNSVAEEFFNSDSNGVSVKILGGNEDGLFKVEGLNLLLGSVARLQSSEISNRKLQLEATLKSKTLTGSINVQIKPHPYLVREGDSLVLTFKDVDLVSTKNLSISIGTKTEEIMLDGILNMDSPAIVQVSPLILRLAEYAQINDNLEWSINSTSTANIEKVINTPNSNFSF